MSGASYEELVNGAEALITNQHGEDEEGNATLGIPTAQNVEVAKVLALLAIANRLTLMATEQ